MNYLAALAARIRAGVDPELVPPASDDLFLLYAVLARAKGRAVTAEDVHDAWVAWATGRGDRHDALRPFAELEPDVRRLDEPFVAAIRAAAE